MGRTGGRDQDVPDQRRDELNTTERPTGTPRRGDDTIVAVPLRRPGRWIAAVVVLVVVALVIYGAATNDRFYWGTYGKYLFDSRISQGALVTLELTVLSMAVGIVLGVFLAVMRLTGNPVLQAVSWGFLWIFRGTPVYVQLVFWGLFATLYPHMQFGIPFKGWFLNIDPFVHLDLQGVEAAFFFAFLGLALNEAAYMAEIVRAGITSVGEGQTEAATALGMSWPLTMRRIVLPQAMRVIIPPTGNELISLLKTTSLVVAVPLTTDLYNQASQISGVNFRPVPLLMVAATWYLAITSVLMVGQYFLEKRFARGASRTMTARQLRATMSVMRAGGEGAPL